MKLATGIFAILCIFSSAAVEYGTETCQRNWVKQGCFKDNIIPSRPLSESLLNRRDQNNHDWDGKLLNWRDYSTTLHALACKCAEIANQRGHKVFGLQFYGECWSGADGLTEYNRDGEADPSSCIGIDYKTCKKDSETECVGLMSTNFVYILKNGTEIGIPDVDGNWGEWTSWTQCSRSCNGGERIRTRYCNNPAPSSKGKYCKGTSYEEQQCNMEPCETVCEQKLDIGIVLDGSTSVTRKNWDVTLDFVKTFANEFKVSEEEVHFGVLHFSFLPFLDFKISDKQYWTNDSLAAKLSTIKYPYGPTRTDLALESANKNFFCGYECGKRDGVPQVLLVITDGKSSDDSKPVKEAVQPMKDVGVTIIAIGVGSADENELKEIASDANHVLMLSDYQYLKDILNALIKLACVGR